MVFTQKFWVKTFDQIIALNEEYTNERNSSALNFKV